MMSFMSRKKKFKFHVNFMVEEISSVPFVSGILFAKIRLHDGGNFCEFSNREEVRNNRVDWNSKFEFACKMTANVNTGVLEPCVCRVSVRRELKGGRSHHKLGFADINLAEFAGSGAQSRRYLLEGYDTKHRQDNSNIKITVEMSLISGDPVFKVPTHQVLPTCIEGELNDVPMELRSVEDCSEDLADNDSGKELEKTHSRSSSYVSEQSRGSGYGSMTHSRQSSVGNEAILTHMRTPSTASALAEFTKSERRRKQDDSEKERRVGMTRVDAEDLVEELLQSTDLGLIHTEESSGLQLLVCKDGTTALR
ncbi:early estrogen-induced gene 1 protein isoform X2 [Patella vulgata]|uniref:early estrogen-induced gene 1 protein isoform X2 n=1 Tax=Patella vulgata TaxID=6465 RepID=UPI0021806946|nr:early estrogen-induced gene 1 protein isoform X2 [Patella vulgata]